MVQHEDGRSGAGEHGRRRHAAHRHGGPRQTGGHGDAQGPGQAAGQYPRPGSGAGTSAAAGDRDGSGQSAGPGTGAELARPVRVARVVSGDRLLTVNPVDGSEVQPCPPGEAPGAPAKLPPARRPAPAPAAAPAGGIPGGARSVPLVERDEERARIVRELTRGRSLRLTGPPGSGRSTLLDAVAEHVTALAPDGVVRLSGYRRTRSDLLHDLFAAVHDAPGQRPEGAALRAALRGVGAVVLVDDLEFGGKALDELLDATPECAFLFAATPDVPAPSAGCKVVDVPLAGLSRTGCLELLELAVRRPLSDAEADWAADLWFASEDRTDGLPLRFVQAGALLRRSAPAIGGGPNGPGGAGGSGVPGASGASAASGAPRGAAGSGRAGGGHGTGGVPVPRGMAAAVASRLPGAAREVLRLALALDGELPHHSHLPALTGEPQAASTVAELAADGLVTAAGGHYRLAAGVAAELAAAGYAEGADTRALTVAQHYGWWTGHPAVTAERVAVESDAVHAAIRAAQHAGHARTAVLLARTAAPVLAASLRWSAWERVLRDGQESARVAGEVAQEAYFHHELGVLALCTGRLVLARTELGASIALRNVLGDKRGTVAGRRALALVTDLLTASGRRGGATGGTSGRGSDGKGFDGRGSDGRGTAARGTAARAAAGESAGSRGAARDVRQQAPDLVWATPRPEEPVRRGPVHEVRSDGEPLGTTQGGRGRDAASATVAATLAGPWDGGPSASPGSAADGPGSASEAVTVAGSGRHVRTPSGRYGVLRNTRRNVAAAGAGAVLAAALGAVVTLGNVAHKDDAPADRSNPGHSAAPQNDDGDLTAGEPRHSGTPGSDSPSASSPSRGGGSSAPAGAPATGRAPASQPTAGGPGNAKSPSKTGSSHSGSSKPGGSGHGHGSSSPSRPGGGSGGSPSGSPSPSGGSSDSPSPTPSGTNSPPPDSSSGSPSDSQSSSSAPASPSESDSPEG